MKLMVSRSEKMRFNLLTIKNPTDRNINLLICKFSQFLVLHG